MSNDYSADFFFRANIYLYLREYGVHELLVDVSRQDNATNCSTLFHIA